MAADLLKLRCFIIHLERAYKRAPQVQRLVEALPLEAEIVSAIDGSMQDFDVGPYFQSSLIKPKYPFALRPAEVATFLSHQKCWQRIVDEDVDAGLILEDDVNIHQPTFDEALSLAMENIQQGDVVRFPIQLREKLVNEISVAGDVKLFRPIQVGLGAQAQLITRLAAQKLLAKTKRFDRPVDTYLQLFWEHRVRMLSAWPNGVSEHSENLGGSLIGAKQTLWSKLNHEIKRPIYRLKVSKLARNNDV